MKRSYWWPIIISASAFLLVIVTISGAAFRPLVAFWFLLICPGMAFVRLLHIEEFVAEFTLAIALSIALNTIVAESMVLAGAWSPNGGLIALAGLSILGAVFQILDANGRAANAKRKQC
jgi:hypothetical protein